MTNVLLEVNRFSKSFQNHILLENISLQIHPGEICALVGQNGIGKTVFLKCILGFEAFEDGHVSIAGHPLAERESVRRLTAFIPSDGYDICDLLTPEEYFEFIMTVYQLSQTDTLPLIQELVSRLGVESHLKQLIKELSFGTKKKVLLLGTILYDPMLIVCDEIFEGLDQTSVATVIEIFQERAMNKRAVLFTTHLYHLVESVATTVYRVENNQISLVGK
ncbi:ATP-binding cassette domain-containing protein [Paenibacillus sp. ACRRX]|uniref:ATP-binding cassette domain-containing protein n=1 Tax=unclassified Paenibacillus TaxID=185978 RepID=UPI001EF5DA91|nr:MULTISPECIES: ATP-binding cassette domain-containing protein [unclassified Paenibacillus]MCG7408530.1 ATP-binding cassette domain-containing protein [Paenibacillus sp. ACRRX]MDK8182778.1 ABC transporter ATP-binding protein [Paenibacillus sp. UMB4589-SE434]